MDGAEELFHRRAVNANRREIVESRLYGIMEADGGGLHLFGAIFGKRRSACGHFYIPKKDRKAFERGDPNQTIDTEFKL